MAFSGRECPGAVVETGASDRPTDFTFYSALRCLNVGAVECSLFRQNEERQRKQSKKEKKKKEKKKRKKKKHKHKRGQDEVTGSGVGPLPVLSPSESSKGI